MALSKLTAIRLDDAFTSKSNSAAFQAAVAARSPLSPNLQADLIVAFTASKKDGAELIAAVVSGAALSKDAARRCLIALGDAVAGNELINFIQSSPTAPIKL